MLGRCASLGAGERGYSEQIMGDRTGIEWTDATWNPVTGCTKVSQGCKNCYAERVFPRVYGPKSEMWSEGGGLMRPRRFTDVATHPERLDQPLRWKRPRRIFVNSMSDLFNEAVPDRFIISVFNVMRQCHWHIFQVLTKRPARMRDFCERLRFRGDGLGRMWLDLPGECTGYRLMGGGGCTGLRWVQLGVSCEDQATADERIPLLLQTPAAVRFVSLEPLLGPIDLMGSLIHLRAGPNTIVDLPALDWVIAGGESGPKARPMHPDWVRSLRDQCVAAKVPFFFKQWGEWAPESAIVDDGSPFAQTYLSNSAVEICERGERVYRVGKKRTVALLDGREWKEFPKLRANS